MLVDLDDYFIHQSACTIARVGNGIPNWQERNYFNMHSKESDMMMVCGMGMAPNENQLSCYVISSAPGLGQTSYRALRKLDGARDKLEVGAFSYTIVEPFKKWRIALASNESGLELDLEWTSRHKPWEFGTIHTVAPDGHILSDFMHIQQSGTYQGTAKIDGKVYNLDGWYGERDRTWGIRETTAFWIWSAIQFEDCSLSIYHFETSQGEIQYSNAGLCYEDHVSAPLELVDHNLHFQPGQRVPTHGSFRLKGADGTISEVEFKFMGPLVSYWSPTNPDPANRTASIVNRPDNGFDKWSYDEHWGNFLKSPVHDALVRFRMNGKVGYGIFELLAYAYEPYGFDIPDA